tara:strand:- start:381 stop:566 length:186 start_codon:yes stop_codon:yes gene_type:complete
MESLINEGSSTLQIKSIYSSLSKQDKIESDDSDDSDDEYGKWFNSGRRRRVFKKNYYTTDT